MSTPPESAMITCILASLSMLATSAEGGTLVGGSTTRAFQLNKTSGEATPLSGLGFRGTHLVTGMTYNPNTDTHYLASSVSYTLFELDLATGAITEIGGTSTSIHGLAYHPGTDRLFGTGAGYLFEIDTTTGVATELVQHGYWIEGLAIDPAANTLYGLDKLNDVLLSIDVNSVAVTVIGPVSIDTAALTFDTATGKLYGTDHDLGVVEINTTTAAVTPIDFGQAVEMRALSFDSSVGSIIGAHYDAILEFDQTATEPAFRWSAGHTAVTGLAVDHNRGITYGTDLYSKQLLVVDTTAFSGESIGDLGFDVIVTAAFDPVTDTLYGVDYETDELVTIDTTSGTATIVGSTGFNQVISMTANPIDGSLFAFDDETKQLLTIDKTTGAATAVAPLNDGSIAFTPNGTLFGVDWASNNLIRIDPSNGATTTIGHTGTYSVRGLVAHPTFNDTLIGIDSDTYALVAINTQTAETQSLDTLGMEVTNGMAFDPYINKIYASSIQSGSMNVIDPDTGLTTSLLALPSNQPFPKALAFDIESRVLYGTDDVLGKLVRVNTQTGAITVVGTTGQEIRGLAFDPVDRVLFGCTPAGELFRIDPTTAATTLVGAIGYSDTSSLAIDPDTNVLYGVAEPLGQLLKIEKTTGVGTPIGSTRYGVLHGLAAVTEPLSAGGADVPVTSPMTMVFAICSIIVVGGIVSRRRLPQQAA